MSRWCSARGVRAFLEEAGVEVLGEAGSEAEARAWAGELPPRAVAICSLSMLSCSEVMEHLSRLHPTVFLIALADRMTNDSLFEVLKRGVVAYLVRQDSDQMWRDTIQSVYSGRSTLEEVLLHQPGLAQRVLAFFSQVPRATGAEPVTTTLGPHEKQVLCSLAEGLSLEDLVANLGLAQETIRAQLVSISKKLAINSNVEGLFQVLL